jgi:hypothetical protein
MFIPIGWYHEIYQILAETNDIDNNKIMTNVNSMTKTNYGRRETSFEHLPMLSLWVCDLARESILLHVDLVVVFGTGGNKICVR